MGAPAEESFLQVFSICEEINSEDYRIMKVLLVSNQHPNEQGVGNPIMYRMRNALQEDERVEKVEFVPFYNSLGAIKNIRSVSSEYDVVHIHFGGLYALILWFALIK